MKARDRVYNDLSLGEGTLELGKWLRFFQTFTLFIILTSEASQKKRYNTQCNKIKQPLDPLSFPSNIHTRPHLWQLSGGGGGPDMDLGRSDSVTTAIQLVSFTGFAGPTFPLNATAV